MLAKLVILGVLVGAFSFVESTPEPNPRTNAVEPVVLASGQGGTRAWSEARGHVAIVIDDVGRDLAAFERLWALPIPLTFAILPGSKHAGAIQDRLQASPERPREVLLHLPMEPLDATHMTAGLEREERFLLHTDSAYALRHKIEAALRAVPLAVGVNNHMGSRLTAEREVMERVMEVLAERHLLFLDSRTHASSTAEQVARARGMTASSRQIFLDHDPRASAIEARLREALERSVREPIIVIGHPSAALAAVLERALPTLEAARIGVYPVSRIILAHSEAKTLEPRSP